MEVEELCTLVLRESDWISRHTYCPVYFNNCEVCNKNYAARKKNRQGSVRYCSEICRSKNKNSNTSEYLKEYRKKYRADNLEKIKAYESEWRSKNRKRITDRARVNGSARRRRKGIPARVSNVGVTGVRYKKEDKLFEATFKKKYLYTGKDFFEACCRRKSADAESP